MGQPKSVLLKKLKLYSTSEPVCLLSGYSLQLADPPLVTSDLVGLLLILHSGTSTGTGTAPAQKVSTGLTTLYRGLYSAELDFPTL